MKPIYLLLYNNFCLCAIQASAYCSINTEDKFFDINNACIAKFDYKSEVRFLFIVVNALSGIFQQSYLPPLHQALHFLAL